MGVRGSVFLAVMWMAMGSFGALAQNNSSGTADSFPEIVSSAPVGSRENPARVSSGVMAGLLIHRELPVYSEDASAVSGPVVVLTRIDPEGKVVAT